MTWMPTSIAILEFTSTKIHMTQNPLTCMVDRPVPQTFGAFFHFFFH